MALGIPVASTTAGGLPEMLDHGGGLLAPPNDPQALAEVVVQLLTQPEQVARVRAQATTTVAGFSAQQMAEGVRSVYRSCVSFP
jgi:glycosyltransferase involved in cell wall biosynthesis